MLKRTSTLKQGSSLQSSSQLKNNTNLRSSSNLKTNGRLQAFSTLSRGESRLKIKSYKRGESSPLTGGYMRSQSTIDACRRSTCEICGKPCCGEPHHIISRGAGGADIPENLIQLCGNCHRDVHSGRLAEDGLLWAVAHRYFITPTEVRNIIRKACAQS